jgi:hypothetical protein
VPTGPYTDRHAKVFGKGRAKGVDSWLFLGANRESRGFTRQPQNQSHGEGGGTAGNTEVNPTSPAPIDLPLVMELRLCVQNTNNSMYSFLPNDVTVLGRTETESILKPLNSKILRILVRNGAKIDPIDNLLPGPADMHSLSPFEYVVLTIDVECPTDGKEEISCVRALFIT